MTKSHHLVALAADAVRTRAARLFGRAPRPLAQQAEASHAPGADARVLLALDNRAERERAVVVLQALGCVVTTARDGAQALAAVLERRFDLVLLDCQLAVMDGVETTRRIRAWEYLHPQRQPVPVVGLVATTLAGDRAACIGAGMNDCIARLTSSASTADMLARYLAPGRAQPAGHPSAAPAPQPPGLVMARAPAAHPVYDPAVLAALPMVADGSMPGFAREMLDLFSSSTRTALDRIDTAHADGQKDQQMRLVHTLKSGSAQVGALALSALAGRLEQALRSGTDAGDDWPRQVRHEFERLQLELQARATTEGRPEATPR